VKQEKGDKAEKTVKQAKQPCFFGFCSSSSVLVNANLLFLNIIIIMYSFI